jgi:hypothetical protein
MPTDDRLRQRSSIRRPILIFGIAMTAFYLILGAYLFIDKSFLPGIPSDFRNIFAGLLVLYGIYRGYRIYVDHK